MSTHHDEATELDRKLWNFHQTEFLENFRFAWPRFDRLALMINRTLPQKGRVLDIGFGDGYLLKKLAKGGFQAVGADLSDANVERTEKEFASEGITAEFVVTNIAKMDFPDASFDAIVASEVIEHLTDEDLTRGLAELHRALKPNGILFLTTPANENLKDNLIFCPHCGASFHRWGHKQSFTRERLTTSLNGYSQVRIEKVPFFPSPDAPKIEHAKHTVRSLLAKINDEPFVGGFFVTAHK